jgi:hypothetical protein
MTANESAQERVSVGEFWVQPDRFQRRLPGSRNPLPRWKYAPKSNFQIGVGERRMGRGIIGIKRDGSSQFTYFTSLGE